MSGKTRKETVSRPGKAHAPRKGARLTLSTATAFCAFVASALTALTALAQVLHHLLVWLCHVL
jgi:hypothetical protein